MKRSGERSADMKILRGGRESGRSRGRSVGMPLPQPRQAGAATILACLLALLAACAGPGPGPGPEEAGDDWRAGLVDWRTEREQGLRNPEGYLGLAGLFWLAEGGNPVGSDADATVVLPSGDVPARAGRLTLTDGVVQLAMAPGVAYTVDGEPRSGAADAAPLTLAKDTDGQATRIGVDRFTFWVIERTGALGVRMRDPQSHVLADFTGIDCYESDPAWRVTARYEPFDAPQDVAVPNILGTEFEDSAPGRLLFEVDGVPYVLTPTGADASSLFLVFGDETNGDGSYGGGRFLRVSEPDAEGGVVLDFNRAYNPPCAFSPYTTCPLPTPDNRLPLRVEAGEQAPREHP